MIELDAVWKVPRMVNISGKSVRVPIGVSLDPNLIDFLTKWIRNSGVEFAAKRLKALKIWALHILAGDTKYSESWFSKTHYKGYCIPRLRLFNILIDNRSNLKRIRLILMILNSYKLVMQGSPTLSSITETPTSGPAARYIRPLRQYVNLPRVPEWALESVDAIDTRAKYADDGGHVHDGPMGMYDEAIDAEIRLLWADMNQNPLSLGKVVPIPDKGKWRNILIGNRAIQLKTKKLADWLRNWLWNQPEIASGNQRKMVDFAVKEVNLDRTLLSIDLSEATDRLSVDLQIKLLTSMGVPESYFSFFRLPFHYQTSMYGKKEKQIKEGRYSNGQPMGLFLSFPMFELAHYVILSFSCATSTDARFCICGDDVIISCRHNEADLVFSRYENLITRFGGVISKPKTFRSRRLAEGVGAIFLKGIQKEIRIPSGKLSALEAHTPDTWLYLEIVRETAIGRALNSSWLSTNFQKEYTYQQRMLANEFMVYTDLSDWSLEALRSLNKRDHMPQTYYTWDEELYQFWRNTPQYDSAPVHRFIGLKKYRDALVSHKIVNLYKGDHNNETTKR